MGYENFTQMSHFSFQSVLMLSPSYNFNFISSGKNVADRLFQGMLIKF